MATGPEHYRLAEMAIDNAKNAEGGSHQERFHLDVALIRATLAHAAATAMSGSMPYPDLEAWDAACGVQEEEHDDDSFDPFASEAADANPLRHTPLARAFGAIPDLPDNTSQAALGPEHGDGYQLPGESEA